MTARALAAESEAAEIRYRNMIFGLANSIKAITGYLGGLENPELMAKKRAWETSFRAALAADPQLQKEYGDAWDRIAKVNREFSELDDERRYTSFSNFRLLTIASDIVRLTAEMTRPADERTYSEQQLAALQGRSPEAAARAIYQGTKLTHVQARL